MSTKQEQDAPEQARSSNKRGASEIEQDGPPCDASNWIVRQRFEHGLCHQCGNRIYDVLAQGPRKRFVPVTIAHIVENGRCLLCYPVQSMKAPHQNHRREPEVLDLLDDDDDSLFLDKSFITITSRDTVGTQQHQHQQQHIQNEDDDDEISSILTTRMEAKHYPNPHQVPTKKEKYEGSPTMITVRRQQQQRKKPHRKLSHKLHDSDGLEFVGTITEGTMEHGLGYFCHGERSKIIIYEGEFESGYFHGKGKSHDHGTGCLYEGDFVKGAAHGHGTCRWDQGWEYQGEWQMDKRHGKGRCRQLVEGGEVYDGEWKDDKWDGNGVLTFSGGGKYSGSFRKDKLNGQGTYEFADGSVYTGVFNNDLRHGHGEMTYACGLRYVGEWRDNWRGGKGTLFHTDGSIFKGRFSEDEKDGIGYLHLPDGIVRKEKWSVGQLSTPP